MSTVPEPHVDEIFGAAADEPLPDGFDEADRDFWVAYLRDMHGFDESDIATRPNRWVWNRAQEVLR